MIYLDILEKEKLQKQRLLDAIDLVAEIIGEAKRFSTEQDNLLARNVGNQRYLDNRNQARLELIKHLEKTFGGLQ